MEDIDVYTVAEMLTGCDNDYDDELDLSLSLGVTGGSSTQALISIKARRGDEVREFYATVHELVDDED